jgi:23S rRNA maturation mini-RNase III
LEIVIQTKSELKAVDYQKKELPQERYSDNDQENEQSNLLQMMWTKIQEATEETILKKNRKGNRQTQKKGTKRTKETQVTIMQPTFGAIFHKNIKRLFSSSHIYNFVIKRKFSRNQLLYFFSKQR